MNINIWFIDNIPMNSNSGFCMYRQTNNLITRYQVTKHQIRIPLTLAATSAWDRELFPHLPTGAGTRLFGTVRAFVLYLLLILSTSHTPKSQRFYQNSTTLLAPLPAHINFRAQPVWPSYSPQASRGK